MRIAHRRNSHSKTICRSMQTATLGATGAPFVHGTFQHVRLARKHSKQRGLLCSEPYPLRGLSFCPDFPFSPRANHSHATGPNRPRPIGIAWPRPLDSGRSICPIDSNHPIRIKAPDLDQGKVPSPCQRPRIRLLNLTPGLTVRSALPTRSFGSPTKHGPSARLFHPESFGLATRLGPNRPAWLNRTV